MTSTCIVSYNNSNWQNHKRQMSWRHSVINTFRVAPSSLMCLITCFFLSFSVFFLSQCVVLSESLSSLLYIVFGVLFLCILCFSLISYPHVFRHCFFFTDFLPILQLVFFPLWLHLFFPLLSYSIFPSLCFFWSFMIILLLLFKWIDWVLNSFAYCERVTSPPSLSLSLSLSIS